MKHTIFLLLILSFFGEMIAQTTYESPHVKDGKTIQLTISSGFYPVEDASFGGSAMFCTKKDVSYDNIDVEGMNNAVLGILHESNEDQSLEDFAVQLKTDFAAMGDEVTLIQEPTLEYLNGRKCLIAAMKGEMDGESVKGIYLGAISFGDYVIVLGYYARENVTSAMPFEDFKKMMSTWKEIETTKEDGMVDLLDMWDLDTEYQNDLFETSLTYEDILPDPFEDWDEPFVENRHLLCEFVYRGDRGSIKIFSGGLSSNYPTDEEKARAIERVTDWYKPMKLTLDSQFSNGEHFFKLYSIEGGGTMTSVYTTIVNRELVFFIVDGGENPDETFKPAVRDFMFTMWVDFVEEE